MILKKIRLWFLNKEKKQMKLQLYASEGNIFLNFFEVIFTIRNFEFHL